MKQTAKYIIKKSLDIASISNSDTISYTDKLQLLNDTFTQLYQWSINAGEKNWVREVYLVGNGGKYQLPSDFYQLEQIYMNDEEYFGNYEIVNGYINIKTMTGRCKMRYFTRPVYLSFPNDTLDVDMQFEGNFRHANGIYFVTTESIDKGGDQYDTIIRVYDIEKAECVAQKTFEDEDISQVYIYRDCYWIPYDNDVYAYDFEGNEIIHRDVGFDYSDMPVCDYIYLDAEGGVLYNIYGQIIYTFPDDFVFNNAYVLFRENIGTVVLLNDDKVFVIDIDQNTIVQVPWNTEIMPFDFGYFNEELNIFGIIWNSKSEFATVKIDGSISYDKIDTPKVPGGIVGLKVNEETGYGFLILNRDKSMRIQSFVPDIEFNAPNNMFYSLLLYKLAQAYNTKLNVENSRLDETVMEMEHTYFDTLKTNISKYGVIKDVYERRSVI